VRLDRALDRFDGDMARRNCSTRSRDDYFRTLCRLFVFVPRDPVVIDVTPDALRECLDTWATRKPNTRYKIDAIFRKFCAWLVAQELLDRDPMLRIPRPVKQHPEDIDVVSLSEADVIRMFKACETPRELVCLSVLAYLGPRRAAASRLRVRDLDLENAHMRFFEKGGRVIWKPMPDELAALIAEAMGTGIIGTGSDDYVIPMARKQRRKDERDDRVIYYLVK
jgi:integrase